MIKSQNDLENLFLTTNQDYGSFYSGRLQHCQINPNEIAFELSINDQVRNERQQFQSIAYDIMFDKHDSIKIITHDKKKSKPVVSRRQLKYIKSINKSNEEKQITIINAIESYNTFIKCIYENKSEKNPHLSNTVLEVVANELFLLNPNISSDQLAETMIAITVPHEYLGMPAINSNKPYPGTASDCTKTSGIQHLLDEFQSVQKMIDKTKQQFNLKVINSQPMEGVRYIYNPFTNIRQSYRI